MTTLIVDYGMSNIGSVRRALQSCDTRVLVSNDPNALCEADRIVLPGVGSFPEAMRRLHEAGWIQELRSAAINNIPILGICLGMQILAERGEEVQVTEGLGLVPGVVRRLAPQAGERVPHVGWNTVDGNGPLFEGIPHGTDFYFVHSYAYAPETPASIGLTPFAGGTVAAVARNRVYGVQFHPEKSSKAGLQVIRNFLKFA